MPQDSHQDQTPTLPSPMGHTEATRDPSRPPDTEKPEQSLPPQQPSTQPVTSQTAAAAVSTAASTPAPAKGQKPCHACHTPRDVLIRCQADSTHDWVFLCTGSCWTRVSGGFVDARAPDGTVLNGHYRYGGMWKNKHAYVSAKIKGRAKEKGKAAAKGSVGESSAS